MACMALQTAPEQNRLERSKSGAGTHRFGDKDARRTCRASLRDEVSKKRNPALGGVP